MSVSVAKYAYDLFQGLGRRPHETPIVVQGSGRFKLVRLVARHCYRATWVHQRYPGTKYITFTGGCVIEARVECQWGKVYRIRLKPGWKEDTFNRAVQRLTDQALKGKHEWKLLDGLWLESS